MYIDAQGKRFNPLATIVFEDVEYPGNILQFPEAVEAAGIQEIPDPPRKDEQFYIVTEQDTHPYVVNTPRDLGSVMDAVWSRISARRDTLQESGVEVNGHWFHNDVKSRTQWERMSNKAQFALRTGADVDDPYLIDNEQVAWKTMAGDYVPLTLGLISDVIEALEIQEARIFKAAAMKEIALRQLKNVDAVAAFAEAWDAEWPPTYTEPS